MPDAADQFEIKIVTTADNSGFVSAGKAQEALAGGTQRATAATKEAADVTKHASEAAEESGISHRELRRTLLDIGNVAAPGAGHALMELAGGPVGVALALVGAFELLRDALEEDEKELDKLGDIAAKTIGGGLAGVKKNLDEAAEAAGKFRAALEGAGTDKDPLETELKRSRELRDAQLEADKQIIQSQAAVAEAYIRTNGVRLGISPALIQQSVDEVKRRAQDQINQLDRQNAVADGSAALEEEKRRRDAQQAELDQKASDAREAAEKIKNENQAATAQLENARSYLGAGAKGKDDENYRSFQKQKDDAAEKLAKARKEPKTYYGAGGVEYDNPDRATHIEEAQSQLDLLNAQEAGYRRLQQQIESTATQRAEQEARAKQIADEADAAAKTNQARRTELGPDIDQARRVEAERRYGNLISDAGRAYTREASAYAGSDPREAQAALREGQGVVRQLATAATEAARAHSESLGSILTALAQMRQANLSVNARLDALAQSVHSRGY